MRAMLLLACASSRCLLFVAGFWNFADRVRAEPEPPPRAQAHRRADRRLARAALHRACDCCEQHKGERLLISGVNRIVTDEELLRGVLSVDPELARCCIDLGRAAEDTLGNAVGNRGLGARAPLRRLILVTDDYHMPRSLAELSLAMPEAEIHPYPGAHALDRSGALAQRSRRGGRLGRRIREISRHSRARGADRAGPQRRRSGRGMILLRSFVFLRSGSTRRWRVWGLALHARRVAGSRPLHLARDARLGQSHDLGPALDLRRARQSFEGLRTFAAARPGPVRLETPSRRSTPCCRCNSWLSRCSW